MANFTPYDPQFTQNENNLTQQNLNFWQDWFAKSNPQMPIMKTPSTQPGFTGAAQAGEQYGQNASQLPEAGGSGNLDMTALTRALTNQGILQGSTADIGNQIADFNQNNATGNQYAAQGMGRLGEEGTLNTLANQTLPMSGANVNMSTQDFINQLKTQEENAQGDPLQWLTGAAGTVAGTLIGDPGLGSQMTPSEKNFDAEQYQNPNEYYQWKEGQ